MSGIPGRHVGRAWGRFSGSCVKHRPILDYSSVPIRRFESNLSLPALDRQWRLGKDKRKSENARRGFWPSFGAQEKAEKRESKGKMYILPMFPYPSGDLHLGHLRVYTISDVLSRFRRMQGYEVIHPIGWDAFGLPAENAAIERGIDPASWTKRNIEKMKTQLEAMNGHWDWDREFATSDPSFYKHTQQLFLLLHKAGLAYQAESLVNYDPVDKTVLANEQVDANGLSWRSGAKVEQRMLKQWFFKISAFRQELLDDLGSLANNGAWPERVLAMQKNWLGKSTNSRIKFPVVAYDQNAHADIEVFTTRPDTLFGVQYIALASSHPIVRNWAKTDVELQAFLDTIPALSPDSKVGYLLPHVRAVNPLAHEESTPDPTKASLPIYVAPYVIGDYGDGAVMGVPGHDIRDHGFWKHNRYDDPVRMVISPSPNEAITTLKTQPFVHHGHLTSHSGPYAGQTTAEATFKIVSLLESKALGSRAETWRLRDWLISRQRYWGTPIPIIHCGKCGAVPVPEDQLPVELPQVDAHWGKGKAGNPLDEAHDWVNTTCPSCGGAAKRETDTMDTFVDSSWYYTRFADPKNERALFSPEAADANLPVDLYIGGVEHAILHLLYARFISKFLATTPLWPAGSKFHGEPFKRVLTQGMVHGKTYTDPKTGRFLKPDEVYLTDAAKPMVVASNQPANVSFQKMSKSKYNGVDPSTCIATYGADAVRAHILFQAPVSEVLEWDEDKIAGITRWLHRLHEFISTQRQGLIMAGLTMPGIRSDAKSHFIAQQNSMDLFKEASKDGKRFASGGNNPLQYTRDNLKIYARIFEQDHKLWRVVQSTISSVTHSYETSHALNTVVSDLMALTNHIIEHSQFWINDDQLGKIRSDVYISRKATMALLQMMAPITPAFAEECWSILHPPIPPWSLRTSLWRMQQKLLSRLLTSSWDNCIVLEFEGSASSIFEVPFPTTDGTFEMLAPATQRCAVQVNGKLRLLVEIPVLPGKLEGKKLQAWIVKEILLTKDGKKKLGGGIEKGKPIVDVRKAKNVIVVKGGKTVNFVV